LYLTGTNHLLGFKTACLNCDEFIMKHFGSLFSVIHQTQSKVLLRLRAISSAKRQYRDKVESHYKGSNTRSMWAGLKTLTDYKKKISSAEVMSASLPDELNTFYARFESTSPAVEVQKAQEDHCPPVISRADVCRTLKTD
ncbi:hypothetical protein L3Q82_009797, partial [Scortum barcoo]